jgi:outer membrane protein TolC
LQASYAASGRASGFGDLTSDQFSGDYPAWSVGVVVRVPLGNRQARANYQIARLDAEQTLLALKQLEQNIVVEVDNAVGQVQTNLKRLHATRVAHRLAQESLKAEEAKLRAGSSTSFLVLQAQSQLAAAHSAEVRARSDYAQSMIALARAEGSTLSRYRIELEKGE